MGEIRKAEYGKCRGVSDCAEVEFILPVGESTGFGESHWFSQLFPRYFRCGRYWLQSWLYSSIYELLSLA